MQSNLASFQQVMIFIIRRDVCEKELFKCLTEHKSKTALQVHFRQGIISMIKETIRLTISYFLLTNIQFVIITRIATDVSSFYYETIFYSVSLI